MGRVEALFLRYGNPSNGWTPFCDEAFTEENAQAVCEILGYKYGRKHYAANVTFPTAAQPGTTQRLRNLDCSAPARRRLRSSSAGAGASQGLRRAGRRLQGLDEFGEYDTGSVWGRYPQEVDIQSSGNPSSDSSCKAERLWYPCDTSRHLAGAECSNTVFTTAPPPMALPPSPPPPPPDKSPFVRYVLDEAGWGPHGDEHVIEPNLCTSTDPLNPCPGRAELLVPSPSDPSQTVFAPLCGFDPAVKPDFADRVAQHVCDMVYDAPATKTHGVMVTGKAGAVAFAIPSGPVTAEGHFDPSKVAAWAHITAPTNPDDVYRPARLMQGNPDFKVTSEPCTSGLLFSVTCSLIQAD
ncbi:hypothetical protein HYH03_010656 [Edaphochlamys debaryana]|uniref:SRCR domain-containing protein n=1 Tax=Edaphochlamys debaryana TaxID=47281 RepID=A0A835XVH9_9CHLO|nr:hypothetical protein HYH03_010656 [Edaphochlamys debaryana]|eukprot:KAG2490983.1 hypothetical protein HYH03_010656 [Edaphochlamys debaryana]